MDAPRFHVYDTTLRDGAQQEGLNLSVADKLADRAAPGRARRRLHRGRLARARTPRTPSSSPRASTELDLQHAQLAAFGATRRAGVRGRRRPAGARAARRRRAGRHAGRQVHVRHVELALRTTLEENLAMIRDTVAYLRARGPAGLPRRRALLRRLPRRPGVRAGGRPRRRRGRRRRRRPVRHQRRHAARPSSPTSSHDVLAGDRRPARHPLPRRHRLRGRQHPRRRRRRAPPTCRARANGYGERSGNADLFTRRRQPRAQAGARRSCRTARCAEMTRIAHAIAEVTNVAPDPHQPYVGRLRLRAQGRPARQRDQGRPGPLPAHRPRGGRQRHAHAGLRHGRPRLDRAQGPRARARPRRRPRRWSAGSSTGSRSWRPRATRSRRPTPPSSCCCATSVDGRAPAPLRGRVLAGRSSSSDRDGEVRQRGHGQAARRGRADRRHRRGQRPGQRPRPARCARRWSGSTRELGRARARRLQGPHPRRARTAPTPSPGC